MDHDEEMEAGPPHPFFYYATSSLAVFSGTFSRKREISKWVSWRLLSILFSKTMSLKESEQA